MAPFHFRLATLLKLRETARDQRRSELAESQRADAELQERIEQLRGEQERLQAECRAAAGPGAVDLPRLVEGRQYAAVLRARQDELARQRAALAVEIRQRRQALVEADREVRVLEKLRENRRQMHQQEESRKEAKRLDDAALQAARS
jgi:flagellar protein FliJ